MFIKRRFVKFNSCEQGLERGSFYSAAGNLASPDHRVKFPSKKSGHADTHAGRAVYLDGNGWFNRPRTQGDETPHDQHQRSAAGKRVCPCFGKVIVLCYWTLYRLFLLVDCAYENKFYSNWKNSSFTFVKNPNPIFTSCCLDSWTQGLHTCSCILLSLLLLWFKIAADSTLVLQWLNQLFTISSIGNLSCFV